MAADDEQERRLDGCVVVVIGAGTPAGRSASRRLASAGATVVAADPDADAAGGTVAEIRDAGGRGAAFVGDVDDDTGADALIEMIAELFPRAHSRSD